MLVRGRSLEVHPDDILERDDLGHTVEGLGLWRGEKGDLLEADFNPTLVNEAEVLAHVLSRLRADEPYTKAGPHTLVCVNSHKWLPLPSGDEQFRQRVSRSGADAVLPATALGVVVSTATANAPQSPRSPSETDEGGGLVSGAAAAGGGEGSNNSNNPSTSPLGGLGCGDRSLLALPPHPYVEAKAALLRVAPLGPHASAVDRPQLFVMAGGPGSGKSHTVWRRRVVVVPCRLLLLQTCLFLMAEELPTEAVTFFELYFILPTFPFFCQPSLHVPCSSTSFFFFFPSYHCTPRHHLPPPNLSSSCL